MSDEQIEGLSEVAEEREYDSIEAVLDELREFSSAVTSERSAIAKALRIGREFRETRLLEPGIDVTPNWYRVRQAPPGNYSKFRIGWISRSKGIRAVYGKNKKTGKWDIQSLLFDKKKWTRAAVRKWVKSHNFKIL